MQRIGETKNILDSSYEVERVRLDNSVLVNQLYSPDLSELIRNA